MRFLVFFIFLLCFGRVFAQDKTDFNYTKKYHPLIHKAEWSILNSDYNQALYFYREAFLAAPKGFMKDHFNAAVCASLINNDPAVFENLLKVAGKGVGLDFIKNEIAFQRIQKDSYWRAFEREYLDTKLAFEKKINKDTKSKLHKLVEQDMEFRKIPDGTVMYADTIDLLDKINALELEKIIDLDGFPDEEILGQNDNGTPIIRYPFYSIFSRQTPDNQIINFSNILFDAIRKGKILPHTATHLMATINANDVFFARYVFKIVCTDAKSCEGTPYSSKVEKWVYRRLPAEDEKKIDQLREQNGLESLSEYRRKIQFALTDNRFLFPYKAFAQVWLVDDPSDAQQYLDGTSVLE